MLEYCNYGDEQPSVTLPLALLWEFIMTGVKFICWNQSGSGAQCFFCLEWSGEVEGSKATVIGGLDEMRKKILLFFSQFDIGSI